MSPTAPEPLPVSRARQRVIAGPILGGVCVWVATHDPVHASLAVYRAGRERQGALGSGDAQSVRLGERLVVHLLTARPGAQRFPADELLTYDLQFGGSASSANLADLGLVGGRDDLTYRGFALPSFSLRESCGPLHVLHGSCRKLHGKGQGALLCADELLEQTSADVRRRPSALFLTGDQIYANDVAPALITYLNCLGAELTGRQEAIPGIPPPSVLPIGGRRRWIHHAAAFTSPRAANHLMTFGEFAAAYLLAFSDALWPDDPRELAALAERADPGMGRRARARLGARIADLDNARRALPAVRRVLANVPTYMLFDDHDVTDWNLTKSWRDRVFARPAGRRIVANALAAFWAFQGWGNDPSLFDRNFTDTIEARLARGDDAAAEDFEQRLWGFDRWSFCVPTRPPTVCLDTRTQRAYDSAEGAARLLRPKGFDRIAELVKASGHTTAEPLLLVSATPVCGLELQERRQKLLATRLGPYQVDFEGWHSNLHGLVELMQFLAKRLGLKAAVVLSGDVHYGMTVEVRFTVEDTTIPLAQLVSSGLKHSGTVTRDLLHLLGRLSRSHHQRIGWASLPDVQRLGTLKRRLLFHAANTDIWATDGLVFLSPAVAREVGVDRPPDYREVRTYLRPNGRSPSPLIGENNIGSVVLDGHTRSPTRCSAGAWARPRTRHAWTWQLTSRVRTAIHSIRDQVMRVRHPSGRLQRHGHLGDLGGHRERGDERPGEQVHRCLPTGVGSSTSVLTPRATWIAAVPPWRRIRPTIELARLAPCAPSSATATDVRAEEPVAVA